MNPVVFSWFPAVTENGLYVIYAHRGAGPHRADLVDAFQSVHVVRLLGVQRVVPGAYVKRRDRLRVTARFVDTAIGAIVDRPRGGHAPLARLCYDGIGG